MYINYETLICLTVNILLGNECDYNFYRENVNLIKGVSRIENVYIYLEESMKNDNEDLSTDSNNVYTTRYMYRNDCSLLFAVKVSE